VSDRRTVPIVIGPDVSVVAARIALRVNDYATELPDAASEVLLDVLDVQLGRLPNSVSAIHGLELKVARRDLVLKWMGLVATPAISRYLTVQLAQRPMLLLQVFQSVWGHMHHGIVQTHHGLPQTKYSIDATVGSFFSGVFSAFTMACTRPLSPEISPLLWSATELLTKVLDLNTPSAPDASTSLPSWTPLSEFGGSLFAAPVGGALPC